MDTTHALIFTAYMIPVGLLDNILKPVLMARGLTTPMPVVMVGVIGGTIAYGIVGLFFGPIVLSVAWAVMRTWVRGAMRSEGRTAPSKGDHRRRRPVGSHSTTGRHHSLLADAAGLRRCADYYPGRCLPRRGALAGASRGQPSATEWDLHAWRQHQLSQTVIQRADLFAWV